MILTLGNRVAGPSRTTPLANSKQATFRKREWQNNYADCPGFLTPDYRHAYGGMLIPKSAILSERRLKKRYFPFPRLAPWRFTTDKSAI